jgi:aldose 1-epimerase
VGQSDAGWFHADGRFYPLNRALKNLQIDSATGIAIHGLLAESSRWEILHSGESSLTSRFQFWRHPELMAHWPFAHEYEMTYRLIGLKDEGLKKDEGGALEISLTMTNLSVVRMPVAVGFHPWFAIPGVPRAQWSLRLPARKRIVHDENLLATGELVPAGLPEVASLAEYHFNSGYTALEDCARFRIESSTETIEIRFGPGWPVAIVWGPEGEDFLCVEPMAAPSNGINLHHRGLWPGLQWIEPGAVWQGGFAILNLHESTRRSTPAP